MAARNVGIVFRKELLDTLKDRRTIVSSIVIPLLMFPLIILVVIFIATTVIPKAVSESPTVMLKGEEGAPALAKQLREDKDFRVVPFSADYVTQINEKKLRAVLEFPAGFEANLQSKPEETQILKIYHYEGEIRSQAVLRQLESSVKFFGENIVTQRLAAAGLAPSEVKVFGLERLNVASAEKVTGNIIGFILPYFIIILCLTGAMYPAMDLTAGEKERGTMETILASPVRRSELVLGKFFLILCVSVTTTALSVISLAITVLIGGAQLAKVGKGIVVAVSAQSAAVVFLMVVPLAATFSAALLAISLIARNYREAQSYLGPLMFLVIIPGMASMMPGVELNSKLALVPILNVSLVAKEIFAGQYHWNLIGLIFLSTCVYAAVALFAAVRQFNREEVLFRT
ncbi:MAG: ABC transporter permease [Acidobacteria bacterium]|nr:ABC transporter permease [Acidobacteriota bacterium]MCL5288415.1 ABC transporter permease [Acidobacteriota bacterium]